MLKRLLALPNQLKLLLQRLLLRYPEVKHLLMRHACMGLLTNLSLFIYLNDAKIYQGMKTGEIILIFGDFATCSDEMWRFFDATFV